MSTNLRMAVMFILDYLNQLATFNFPGTSIPFIVVLLSPAAIYFLWHNVICKIFDQE